MGDIVDKGNEAAEIHLRSALSKRKKPGPRATGYCFNCEAKLMQNQRWCDSFCREDWMKLERAKLMAPRDPDPVGGE